MRKREDSLKEQLACSPEYAAEYLNAVLEEDDLEALRLAFRYLAEIQSSQAESSPYGLKCFQPNNPNK